MSKELMLALPEVAYLVERIPVARYVLKPTAIHLRFCQLARESNMPLKEQCRLLSIPWHARKATAETASKAVLEAARITEATVFVSTFPSTKADAAEWCKLIVEGRELPAVARHWLAFNAVGLSAKWDVVKDYLRTLQALAKSTGQGTVIDRAEKYREGQNIIARERYGRQWNLLRDQAGLWQNVDYGLQANYQRMVNNLMQDQRWMRNVHAGNAAPARIEDKAPIAYEARLLEPFASGDFVVQLLHTYEEFRDEGQNMHHCVEQYFPRAKYGACRIVRVTLAGRKHVTAEFTADWELVQAKGPTNINITHADPVVPALRLFGARQKGAVIAAPPGIIEKAADKTPDPRMWTGIDYGRREGTIARLFGWGGP